MFAEYKKCQGLFNFRMKKEKEKMKTKTDEIGLPCGQEEKKKFYIAVDDTTTFRGKKNKMERVHQEEKNGVIKPYDFRLFGEKFVDSPKTALLNVVFEPKDSCNKDVQNEFFKRVTFNEQNKTYLFDEYLTIGTQLPPKPHHWAKFLDGEYELYLVRHEIQIMSTNIETIDLPAIKKSIFEKRQCCHCEFCPRESCKDRE